MSRNKLIFVSLLSSGLPLLAGLVVQTAFNILIPFWAWAVSLTTAAVLLHRIHKLYIQIDDFQELYQAQANVSLETEFENSLHNQFGKSLVLELESESQTQTQTQSESAQFAEIEQDLPKSTISSDEPNYILASFQQPIIYISSNKIRYINQQALDLMAIDKSPTEWVGQRFEDLIQHQTAHVKSMIKQILSNQEAAHFMQDAQTSIDWYISPIQRHNTGRDSAYLIELQSPAQNEVLHQKEQIQTL